jgi:mono/diheme cytochrome c family protein
MFSTDRPRSASFVAPLILAALGFGVAAASREVDATADAGPDPRKLPGWPVYVKHCSACHGESGDGQGVAARFLDPAPRDFEFGRFRFVSTENAAPSGKDLYETIGAGLAGTAMLPFAHLGEEDVWKTVDVVLAFRERGLRRRLAGAFEGSKLDEEVKRRTTPTLADDPAAETIETYESAARGLVHYRAHCAKCHGADGRGLDAPEMKDEEGRFVRAPDLTRGVFKQSPLKKNWFARVRLGMPGSPMPAVTKATLDDAGVWDLVHYLRTLASLDAQALADAATRDVLAPPLVGAPPATPDDPRFAEAPETWIPFVPFRRDEWTTPGLFVRALHTEDMLWFRVVYPDATEDSATAADPARRSPPDGLAARTTAVLKPPVLPYPGQPAPIDRTLSLRGPMPERADPVFDAIPRFDNPERVCRMVALPDRAGEAAYRGGSWHVLIGVRTLESGDPRRRRVSVSFAAFDGALRRGPMPTAFTPWCEVVAKRGS